jgi:hypothetical protein
MHAILGASDVPKMGLINANKIFGTFTRVVLPIKSQSMVCIETTKNLKGKQYE